MPEQPLTFFIVGIMQGSFRKMLLHDQTTVQEEITTPWMARVRLGCLAKERAVRCR